jgi:hypothetical protein
LIGRRLQRLIAPLEEHTTDSALVNVRPECCDLLIDPLRISLVLSVTELMPSNLAEEKRSTLLARESLPAREATAASPEVLEVIAAIASV